MKTFLAVIVPFCVAAFAWYLNNRPAPDLRYTFSDTIETHDGGAIRVAQQVEIANVGNRPAQPVRARVNRKLDRLTVIKDSEADNFRQYETPTGGVELIYDVLRANGHFKIIVSAAEPITQQNLEIWDQNRQATLALSSPESAWISYSHLLFWAVMIVYGVLLAKDGSKLLYETTARRTPEDILKRGKPFYVTRGVWRSCQDTAISTVGERNWSEPDELSAWRVYRLLDAEKPSKVSDDDWNRFVPRLSAGFIKRVSDNVAAAVVHLNPDSLKQVLRTKKPSSVPETEWNKLINSIGESYTAASVARVMRWGTMRSEVFQKAIMATKPDGLPESSWEAYQDQVKALYVAALTRELLYDLNPWQYLRRIDLTCLSEDDAKRVRTLAYKIESSRMPNVATAWGAKQFLDSGKPEFLGQTEYEELERVARIVLDLESREKGVQDREVKVGTLESDTSAIKTRVLRQLEIIDAFTRDPGTLDGIEDYEGAFAPRNLANLKALGELHKAAPVRS
jgi:hypothetical protein